MNLAQLLAGINWLAVVVATVIAFAVGATWYSKALFGNAWMEEVGLTEETMNSTNMPVTFGGTFVLQFLSMTALAACLGSDSTWLSGLEAGLLIGVFWVATAYGITYLFERRTMRLFMINGGYYVVLFAIVGTVLGYWH